MRILSSLIILLYSFPVLSDTIYTREEALEALYSIPDGGGDGIKISKELDIGKGIKTTVSFGATHKGNGGFTVLGTLIKLFDVHDDSIYFKNDLLDNSLEDINGDGYKDILLWGTAIFSGDKGELGEERNVIAILLYSPEEGKFVVKKKSPEIDIWEMDI